MPKGPLSSVIEHVRAIAAGQGANEISDADLLQRFVRRKDEVAFEALMPRHGPMVLAVCRRLLPNPQDAEDAFQVVFLVLARKAASVRPGGRLAAWLHGVARNAALKARQAAGRRRAREKQVKTLPEPVTVADGLWHDLLPLLDQEVGRLPEKYRVPVVLCDLKGKTRGEAARQLGWPEGTVAGRLARARAMLAGRLAKRGAPPSGGVLAAVLSQNPASAPVPPSLLFSTIKGAAGAGAVPAPVAALTLGVLKAMMWTKLKSATAVLLAAAALCGGSVLLARPFVFSRGMQGAAPPSAGPKDGREPPALADDAPAPVTAKFIRKRGGKPPMRFVDVKLEMRNSRDHPVWLLTRYSGDEPLPEKGDFQSGSDQPFGGQEYDGAAKGGEGKAVEVHFLGKPSFRAFYLPAKATIAFENFEVESWSDVTRVEFWEASSLRVNGRTPLEKWLPYPTLSDGAVVVPSGTDWKNLDWDADKLRGRADYPKEAVKTVTAVVEKKWTVPITGIDKGGDD